MLYVTENDVRGNLSMKELIPALKDFISDYGKGAAFSSSRNRIIAGTHILNTMPASAPKYNLAGLKSYISSRNGFRAVVNVFTIDPPDLLAVVDANILGQMRTGALPAMVTSLLLKQRSVNFSIFGSGFQAETQLTGMATAFHIDRAFVYSRHGERSRAYAERYSRDLGVDIVSVDKPEEALRHSDVVSTITTSRAPLFTADMLPDHYHINLAGGNLPNRSEAGPDVIGGSSSIIVEHLDQAFVESGEIIGSGMRKDDPRLVEMAKFVSDPSQYSPGQRTIFKSMGIGIEDLCAAYVVLRNIDAI
jgi:alanine dehydrogenase